ncbi:LLM class flavin-dependent oxidoreductase [Kitasatospora phosalacinea]|uniref:LLM class flavin-dependent oxidoreductase n=1 Tax=Kitasatospora phosalacinea TaxID=2065 RepID=A0ABW6GPA4_9ACTN
MTATGRVSVLHPVHVKDPFDLRPLAELVREGAAARLWLGQSVTLESHHVLAYLAGAGYRIPVGLSVALTALRHPYDAAVQARSLGVLTGHRPVVGYGAGEPEFVAALHGAPYARPASAVAEYVDVVRRLLHERRLDHPGPLFPVRGARLPDTEVPPGAGPPEVGAGVLRPGMARAAGAVADTAITWLTPPDYVRDVLAPALERGARAAGRERPRIVTVVHAALDRPGRNAMVLAQRATRFHLRAPHYVDMLRRAGLDVDASDPVSSARELVEEGVFLFGGRREVRAGIERLFAAGVDEVVVNPVAVSESYGVPAAVADLREVLEETASAR